MSRVEVDDRLAAQIAEGFATFPTACPSEGAHPGCEGPDLTPRTACLLAIAGRRLAEDVRVTAANCRTPVPMYYLARALDRMSESLEHGRRPAPTTLAGQLCLHVMIACATDLAFEVGDSPAGDLPYSDHDYDFERLYDTLLPGDEHESLIWEVQQSPRGGGSFDFPTLCEVTPDGTLHELFQRPVRRGGDDGDMCRGCLPQGDPGEYS